MAEVVLVKFKAKGRRDAGEMPLGTSQLTDNVKLSETNRNPLQSQSAIFKTQKAFHSTRKIGELVLEGEAFATTGSITERRMHPNGMRYEKTIEVPG